MDQFEGKVAVITGAASGIGKAITEHCISEGMHVVMADIEASVLEQAAAELKTTTNNGVLPVVTNVAIESELQNLLDEAVSNFGGVQLLFNNAGVGGGGGNAWTATQKDWDWVMGVNLWSVIHGLRVFVPQMLSQDEPGHIVNTASMAGLLGGTTNAMYSVTKHGVVGLTENLAVDLANEGAQIGCSVLCPGFVNTNIFDSGRNRPAELINDGPVETPTAEQQTRLDMFKEILKQGMPPEELAGIVFDSIRQNRLYILTHEHFHDMIRARADNIISGENPAAEGLALNKLTQPEK